MCVMKSNYTLSKQIYAGIKWINGDLTRLNEVMYQTRISRSSVD